MTYLLIANMIVSSAILAVAAGFGLHAWRRHKRKYRSLRSAGNPARDYTARTNWKMKPGSLNYSSFIYLDVDRDGRYGLADRPMGGIVVRLSGEHGHLLTQRTNGNGFANFAMSARSGKAQIRVPGPYRFTVSVPPGWICTSANDVQTMTFALMDGAPAGVGAAEMVKPVGIAPERRLRGTISQAGNARLRFFHAQEMTGEVPLQPDAPFDLETPPGADAVEIECTGHSRRLVLSAYPTHVGAITPAQPTLPRDAALRTIDFDDVTSRGLRKIPSGYEGLNWFNLNAISRDFQAGQEGYVNGNTSGNHTCYTSSGHPAEVWSDQPFGFHSVMLSSAWLRSEGETCVVESWREDELAAHDEITVSALAPVHYAPMLAGITRIRFSSRHSWQIVLDDLVIAC